MSAASTSPQLHTLEARIDELEGAIIEIQAETIPAMEKKCSKEVRTVLGPTLAATAYQKNTMEKLRNAINSLQ